jgi:hypothetical protein
MSRFVNLFTGDGEFLANGRLTHDDVFNVLKSKGILMDASKVVIESDIPNIELITDGVTTFGFIEYFGR